MREFLFICIVLLILFCKEDDKEQNLRKVSIGIQDNEMSAIITTADNQGFFKKHGLKVEIKKYASGKLALEGMLNGDTELATSADIPVINHSSNRSDISIITTIAKSNEAARIIARKDSGINTPMDLKGKIIATQRDSAVHFYLHLFHSQYGIKESEIDIKYMEPTQLPAAIINNEVDAISMRDPFIQQVKDKLGEENLIEFFDPSIYIQPFVVTSKDSFLNENKDIIELFLSACIDAELYLEKKNSNIGINYQVDLDQSLLTGLEDASRWIIENKSSLNKKINVLSIVNSQFLKSVAPDRVKILSESYDTLTLADTPQPLNGLIYIAREMGFFKDEGIELKYKKYSSGKACLDALIEGEVDIATAAESPFVNAILNNEDIYNISTIQTTGRNVVLLGKKDSGIHKAKDLKGKKIGVTLGSGGEFFTDIFLLYNGINKGDVEIVDVKPNDMFDVIKMGTVDAVCTWNPHVIKIQKEFNENISSFYAEQLYVVSFNIISDTATLKNRKESLVKFIKALVRAEDYLLNNQDSSISIISESINMDENLLRELWDIYRYKVSLDKSLVTTMNDLGRWTLERKGLNTSDIPNFSDYFYPDILLEIQPDAVRLK